MIIYNVTVSVDQIIEIQWLEWMQSEYIQAVIDTGCFTGARLTRVQTHVQPDNTSYSVQFYSESNDLLKRFEQEFADEFSQRIINKFGDKALEFKTELELIADFYGSRS